MENSSILPRSTFVEKLKTLPRNVYALGLVSLLNDTATEIIYPLLPLYLTLVLGASPLALGIIEGAAEALSSFLKLLFGYFSDKFSNRKLPVLAGYCVSALIRPFLGYAVTWQQVLAMRVGDRFGKGIRSAPRDALIADAVTPEKRGLAFGIHRAADNIGAVFGPLIGFILISLIAVNREAPTADEYTKIFLWASVPAALSLLVIVFFVREIKSSKEQKESLAPDYADAPKVWHDRNFRRYLLVIALFTLSNSSDAFLILRARDAGIEALQIPLVWLFHNLCKVVFSIYGGNLSDKIGRKKLIIAGWLIYAAVYVAFGFAAQAWQIWILFAVYGIYYGLTEGAEKALVADLVPSSMRGTAFGFYHFAIGATVFPASLIFGALWKFYGAPTAFFVSALVSLLSTAMFLTVRQKNA